MFLMTPPEGRTDKWDQAWPSVCQVCCWCDLQVLMTTQAGVGHQYVRCASGVTGKFLMTPQVLSHRVESPQHVRCASGITGMFLMTLKVLSLRGEEAFR